MRDDELPTDSGRYAGTVDPINRKRQNGKVYEDKFAYNTVAHQFNADEVLIDGCICKQFENTLYYRYPGKPPVMLDGDDVRACNGIKKSKCEEQAYYLLSQLEYAGYVNGWRKI